MNRHIVYPGQIPLETDILNAIQDAYYAAGWLSQSALGVRTAVVGLAVTPTIPASLQVNVAPGAIYSFQTVDSSSYGSLNTDSNQFLKQGIAKSSQTLTLTPPGTTGQSINYLIQVQFSETDTAAVTLPYYNASNPSIAWSGPNNTGTSQNTVRQDLCVVQLKAGTPAATGSQTTPSPDAGFTGIYVVTVANGQTTITSGNISQLATAPYFPTLPQVPTSVQSGQWLYSAAGGSVNLYTATLSPIPPALVTGMEIIVNFGTPNTTTTPTLNVNGLGATLITKQNSNAVAAGDITGFLPLIYDGTNWRINGLAISDIANSSLIQVAPRNIVPFTSSGTWTCPASVTRVYARVWAGGGGGGGAGDTGSVAGAPGAGSGEYREGTFTVVPGTVYTITVGAGGTAGSSAPSTGGNGGSSSFDTLCTAIGGAGSTAVLNTLGGTLANGGTGGSGGQIAIAGNGGGQAILYGATTVGGGIGGSPGFGRGVNSPSINGSGAAGLFPGGGGTGGSSVTNGVGNAGGAGGAGYIILEY